MQHNERCVQYTTKSIFKNVSKSAQKADLICTQNSRDMYPTNCTKNHFKNAKRKLYLDG